jgi:hypothetical protein
MHLFAWSAVTEMEANSSERAFCVLTFHECWSVTIVQRQFRTYRACVRYVTKTGGLFLLNKKIHILLSQVYCVWQVVKTQTIILNNPVLVDFYETWCAIRGHIHYAPTTWASCDRLMMVVMVSVAPLNSILTFFVVLELWKVVNFHYLFFFFLVKTRW